MISLSPNETQMVSDWGREELVKSLKVPSAFDVFQSLIKSGEFKFTTISLKLAPKLGVKNGKFMIALQKFVKKLQKEGAESIKLPEHKEIYKLSLREKKDANNDNVIEQETHTITDAEPNQHGATQISKTVFSSGNNNDQKTILVTVSFDDKDDPRNESQEEQEKRKNENDKITIETSTNGKNQDEKQTSNDIKDDTNENSIYKLPNIDNDSSDGDDETESLAPQDPTQQFLEVHKKFLYAREEARFNINQKIKYNLNSTQKVTFQPRGWQNLFTLTKSNSESEEEEYDEIQTANILVDDDTPVSNLKQNQSKKDSSDNDEKIKRRHHKHRRRH